MTASLRCIVICEGSEDFQVSTVLFWRELAELPGCDWVTDSTFVFSGLRDDERFVPWQDIPKRQPPRLNGFRDGLGPDGATARRALLLCPPDACVMLVRDCDGVPVKVKRAELESGVQKARKPTQHVVVATPARMLEAWLTPLFSCPETLRAELGFDPCRESHRLDRSGTSTSRRNPKTVLNQLGGFQAAVERLATVRLSELSERATHTGLPEFQCSIRCEAGPLVTKDTSRLCDCRE